MKEISVVITDSHAVSDMKVEAWYQGVLNASDYGYGDAIIHVSTGVMFNRLRLGVLRKEIAPFKVICEVTGWKARVKDRFANMDDWTGYPFDVDMKNVQTIIKESIALRKEQRAKEQAKG